MSLNSGRWDKYKKGIGAIGPKKLPKRLKICDMCGRRFRIDSDNDPNLCKPCRKHLRGD